jgi:DNA-binding transcriptional ArsR family regulator
MGVGQVHAAENVIETIKARFADIRCSRVEQVIGTMANPVRFHILCALTEQPFTVSELVEICGATTSNVSQQLKMMWMAGYLDKTRDGKQIRYRLKDDRILKMIRFLEDIYQPEGEGCADPD